MAGGVSTGVSGDDLKFILKVAADTTEAERQIGAMAARVANQATLGLAVGGRALAGLQGTTGPVGVGFDAATGMLAALSKTAGAFGPFVEALAGVPSVLKDITNTLTHFAAVASPGTYYQFERALRDVQGVIGQAFIPVLQLMTAGIRMFGDVLANILPNTNEVREALDTFRQAFGDLAGEMKSLLVEIGPVLRDEVLKQLKILALVATGTAKAIGTLTKALAFLMGNLGFKPGQYRSSEGAAARPAEIMGLEEYQRKNILAAYQEPGTLGPAEQTAKSAAESASLLDQIKGILNDMAQGVGVLKDKAMGAASPDTSGTLSEEKRGAMLDQKRQEMIAKGIIKVT